VRFGAQNSGIAKCLSEISVAAIGAVLKTNEKSQAGRSLSACFNGSLSRFKVVETVGGIGGIPIGKRFGTPAALLNKYKGWISAVCVSVDSKSF
jgi:hypothetical protein